MTSRRGLLVRRLLAGVGAATLLVVAIGDPVSARPVHRNAGQRGTGWSWPVAEPHRIITPFEAPSEVWSPGHRGIDIEVLDAAVVSPADGVIHFSGVVVDRPVVSIDHGGGVLSSFEPVASGLSRGDVVSRGAPVGTVQAGHCGVTECVHVGARIDGVYVSPLMFLGGRPAVLLPTRPLP